MQPRSDRTKHFGKNYIGATMQNSKGLSIALYRHGSHDSLWRSFGNRDAHFVIEFA
jgi:hypothetical protein